MAIQRGSGMNVTIDDLHERITIQYADKSRDASGNIIKGERHDRAMVWAKVLPVSSVRGEGYESDKNAVTYRVTVHYRTDILPDDEIVWNGQRMKITRPPYDVEARRMWTAFECEALSADSGEA